MTEYPRGSEWRKWDLHLHAPGTKLSDGYGAPADWDRFCAALEESDVAAFGVTDYFTLDSFFELRSEFASRYPESNKVFFPNLEMRLPESVNKDLQTVDVHLLLRPDLTPEKAQRLLQALKTEVHESGTGRQLACDELQNQTHFESATVSRKAIDAAIRQVFGEGRERKDNVLVVVPANNSGIRAVSREKRKANLADGIDAWADAIFGSDANSAHFMRTDRYEDPGSPSTPKPVFSGCDAHSFDQLDAWLGKTVDIQSAYQTVTWIKADVGFEGLQQTLVEPDERVRIQATKPDVKDPYKVISKIKFTNTSSFPKEVVFNENLVSIIGSRSSGKSALLAYVAHTIDPEHTVAQQLATGQFAKPGEAGPAAGKTWAEVADMRCEIEWGDPEVRDGKIIYIPQNSLFAISGRPKDITEKIAPALYRLSEQYRAAHDQVLRTVESTNHAITRAVGEWFRTRAEIEAVKARMRDLGDRKAIEATKLSLDAQIDALRKEASLSDGDVAAFEALTATFRTMDSRVTAINSEVAQLSPYIEDRGAAGLHISSNVRIDVQTRPSPSELGHELAEIVRDLVDKSRESLHAQVAGALIERMTVLRGEREALVSKRAELNADNADLIARNTASKQIEELIQNLAGQVATLDAFDTEEKQLSKLRVEQGGYVTDIAERIAEREGASKPLHAAFESAPNDLDGMSFGFEEQVEDDVVSAVSDRFNKQERSPYVDTNDRVLDIAMAQAGPANFLEAVANGDQKLMKGVDPNAAATEALTATPAIRFYARLDSDRIGGFERSSMTPGKQALFALTLTLSESVEAWPLLIDQPEDDLDSRAIYDTIVPYLKRRKRERQILMVTHNPNLVVGADSEQVIVTNRHGNDRRNRNDQTFDYLTGSMEHSRAAEAAAYVLETGGIREHACEILDGGEEAFQKRRDKYKMY
jgi:energy-coupling factor transporter ATP-binding protein EcfA2